ncbi:MacB-like periplasmic core domain protein [Candidatus Anstonella stagnisolia]|nr:MacB-like periplasmic core domain protein [Candidatus Anstonella stagnisolia]
MQKDLFLYALRALMQRSLRSYLTILGVVIGICSVFILISIGQGISASVNKELDAFGSHTIIITPGKLSAMGTGAPQSGRFFIQDMKWIERAGGIDILTPYLYGRIAMDYKGEQLSATVIGIEPQNFQKAVSTIEIADGRFLKEGDRQVLVIGDKIAKNYFKKDLAVNSVVTIGGKSYRVIGIMKATGGTLDDTDTTIYAPIDDVREVLGNQLAKDEIHGIYIIANSEYNAEEVAQEIKSTLRARRGLLEGNEDFSVITSAFISEQLGIITGLLTAFLGGIAAISLVVGGVTIANTMFMAVLERYSEIGILKAVGARKPDILKIFLFESGIIGIVGGAIGIVVGLVLIEILSFFGVPVSPSAELAGFCLLFSFLIGIVAGYFPAKNAAEMVPIEALRTE